MDDRISQHSDTSKEDHSGHNHHDISLHSHSHDHSHHREGLVDDNKIVEFSMSDKLGQNYDEFYISGVD